MKVKVRVVPCVGTFTDMCSGENPTILGGIVSLAPPVGAWVVFAHECENIIDPSTMATGMTGKNLLIIFFIYRS